VEFGPVSEDDAVVWSHLERVRGRVTAEAVLSGPGLLRLYRALAVARGETPTLNQPSHVQVAGSPAPIGAPPRRWSGSRGCSDASPAIWRSS
jgi:glucokinase